MCYEKNFSLSNPCSAFCFSNIDVTNMEHPLISPRWHCCFVVFMGLQGGIGICLTTMPLYILTMTRVGCFYDDDTGVSKFKM